MPTQADLFRSFCDFIWNDAGNDEYHTWADAHTALSVLGAKPTGAHDGPGEDDFVEWLFADGSTACVTRNGHGYKPIGGQEAANPTYTNEVQTTLGLISCLRPHTLRVLRENLADIAPDFAPMARPEVNALVGQITELLIDLDGDEAP